jgi:site-specific recombinase XerD
MASLKPAPNTPNWVLSYRDLVTGEWKTRTLQLRRDSKTDTRKAEAIARKSTADERRSKPLMAGQFAQWVDDYINFRYANENTRKRSGYYWSPLWKYLKEHKITHPQRVRYEHIQKYLTYRKEEGVCHNTARQELKFLSTLMDEAVKREYAFNNPLARVRIPKEPSKVKPDLSESDLRKIKAAFAKRPQWMRTVLEICAHTGCRISESSLHSSDVDFKKNLIHFRDSKKDPLHPRKCFSIPLPKGLRPVLKKLFKEHDQTVAPISREQNRLFNKAMSDVVEGATSHCLRVAFITRCHRQGLSESASMLLVNHSNQLVHRIYSRLNVEDVRKAAKNLPPPF